jgi:putative DNA primase/helicase
MNESTPVAKTTITPSPALDDTQAETLVTTWESATTGATPTLLQTKAVPTYQTASRRGVVLVPMHDRDGTTGNLLRLSLRTPKDKAPQLSQSYLLPNADISSARHALGEPLDKSPILFTTDYLSGASLHQSTGLPVVVTFDRENQKSIIDEYRSAYPGSSLLVATDGVKTSQEKGQAVNRIDGVTHISPDKFGGFESGNFNDLQLQVGQKAVKLVVDQALQQLQQADQSTLPPASDSQPTPVVTASEAAADIEDTSSEAVLRKRAAALAKATLDATSAQSDTTPAQASDPSTPEGTKVSLDSASATQGSIEAEETRPIKMSEVDIALTNLKLQYLLANDKYYFRDDTKTVAFEDTGKSLITTLDKAEVARSMVELAKAKGWSTIKLAGSDSFKRKAWLEGALLGVKTQGYAPDAFDREALEARQLTRSTDVSSSDANSISQSFAPDPRPQGEQPKSAKAAINDPNIGLAQRYGSRLAKELTQALTDLGIPPDSRETSASLAYIADLATSPRAFIGTLTDHGTARYEFKDGGTPSYFAKLQTSTGEKIVWGVDIPRALAETNGERPKTGDTILLAFRGSQPVSVKNELTGDEIKTHRNAWYAEKVSQLPVVAEMATAKPSHENYRADKPGSLPTQPSPKEQVLIDVLRSKGAPDAAIATVHANLTPVTSLGHIPQVQPTSPTPKPSL